jgi:pheromone shutdown protein TraB
MSGVAQLCEIDDDVDDDEIVANDDSVDEELLSELMQRHTISHIAYDGDGDDDNNGGRHVDVYLCGSAHISKSSIVDARQLVQAVRPDVVLLELCSSRRAILTLRDDDEEKQENETETETEKEEETSEANSSSKKMLDSVLKEFREGKGLSGVFMALLSWMYSKLGAQVEVTPGAEFRAAFRQALLLNARIVLGDRDVKTTLSRTWHAMSLWHKVKFVAMLLYMCVWGELTADDVEELKQGDVITRMIVELGSQFPSVLRTLLYERDEYLCESIRAVCAHGTDRHRAGPARRIVAVVGLGHVDGITRLWQERTPIDIDALNEAPRMRFGPRFYILTGLAVFFGFIAAALFAIYQLLFFLYHMIV